MWYDIYGTLFPRLGTITVVVDQHLTSIYKRISQNHAEKFIPTFLHTTNLAYTTWWSQSMVNSLIKIMI